jgi:hypothetical protein
MKICKTCLVEKEDDKFYFRDKNKENRVNECITCWSERGKRFRTSNPRKEYHKQYYKTNKNSLLDNAKIYYEKNKGKIRNVQKEYQSNHKDEISLYNKSYYKDNKDTMRVYQNNWARQKSKNDPSFHLRRIVSRSINRAIKMVGASKNCNSIANYLPYTIGELKDHLQSQFETWMTWENHGVYRKDTYENNDSSTWTWHIDHIIPQSKLPFTSMTDDNFKKCWALNNLRPLKSIDNIKKSDKI